jgi:hypothetical protein
MTDFAERLKAIAELKHDWDSYGSPPPTSAAIEAARRMLAGLFVCPTSGGGVQIDLGGDFSVHIDADGSVQND